MAYDPEMLMLVRSALIKKDACGLILLMDNCGAELNGIIYRVLPDPISRYFTYFRELDVITDTIHQHDEEKIHFFTWMYRIAKYEATAKLRLIQGKPNGYVFRPFDERKLSTKLSSLQKKIFESLYFFDNTIEDVAQEFNMTTIAIMKTYHIALGEIIKDLNR